MKQVVSMSPVKKLVQVWQQSLQGRGRPGKHLLNHLYENKQSQSVILMMSGSESDAVAFYLMQFYSYKDIFLGCNVATFSSCTL